MTAADLLTELSLIAGLMVVWVGLVLLMLERDRKRTERRDAIGRPTDTHEGAESMGSRPSSYRQEKEPRATAAREE